MSKAVSNHQPLVCCETVGINEGVNACDLTNNAWKYDNYSCMWDRSIYTYIFINIILYGITGISRM